MHKTKRSIVVLAAVLAGLLLPLSVFSEEGLKIRTIRVGVPVRPTAQITQRFIYIAEKGQVFDVIEKLDDWYLVQLPYGEKGYVHKSAVEELTEAGKPVTETPAKVVAEEAPPVIEKPAVVVEEKAAPPVEVPEKKIAERPRAQPGISVIRPAPRAEKLAMLIARFGYFLASDSAFNEIYENGPVFGGELRLGGRKIAGWLEGGYREHTGKFSFTGEKTKVKVTGIELGALYRIAAGTFSPYAGAGIGYYMFSEKNAPLGEAKQNKIGFCGAAGVSVIPMKWLVLDLRLKYYTCSMKPADFEIDIGGLSLDLGIGVRL